MLHCTHGSMAAVHGNRMIPDEKIFSLPAL
jgi:hypothetical protein